MQPNLLNPLGPRLVLASRSPRRSELLALVGARFDVFAVDVDERVTENERANEHVLRLAEAKARAAHARFEPPDRGDVAMLGVDTIVTIDGTILGKPADEADAARMLRRLSGRVHEVWTGLFLLDRRTERTVGRALRSIVKFTRFKPGEIERYIASGEPLDKAGAYAVQGKGAVYVEAIEGSYSNVVGLPLSHLKQLLDLLRRSSARASQ